MALSRLDNFLKNYEGNLIYVNPTDFDATDSYENQGNSLTRPFKTIQRALIEAARFSYQSGRNNDKIDKTTILVYPGTHYIDNRPGYSIQNINNAAVVKRKTGQYTWVSDILPELNKNFNFDILDTNNDLHKFNSVNGGVILPRGTSIIGLDLRKTKIRPLFVPDPEDENVENSSIFNVTGTCYFTAFTFFDASPITTVFKNYTGNRFVPEFSHHKLVAFAYADGVNKVKLGYEQTNLTDLDMYYYKISEVYGQITGRPLGKYPNSLDLETVPGEFTIVGNVQSNPLGISTIYAGDGLIPTSTITVTTKDFLTGQPKEHGLQVDSPILITGVSTDPISYNGSFTVKEVVGLTTFTYTTTSIPIEPVPTDVDAAALDVASIIIESDTVKSASPYVFNCSLRSVYGLCGMWADGSKADGFKSMVVAQFTGISLQKDENAFLIYENGTYYDNLTLSQSSIQRPLHTNSNSVYKPNYQNFHIRCSNGAFIQCVSIFAIGYSRHFYAESGGDMSITNSNSNFGAVSLESTGYRYDSFDRDNVGHITHVIPPKQIYPTDTSTTWLALDGDKIRTAGLSTERLYLNEYTDINNPPLSQISGFRIGARDNDKLYLTVTSGLGQTTYTAPILMSVPSGTGVSSKKVYNVGRNVGINSIASNIFTLTTDHQLLNGESLRIFSDTGQAPFGLNVDKIYYAITNSLNSNQIKLALSYNDAISGNSIIGIGNNGGVITVISTVSDKVPGDVGHPIAFDKNINNWYINSSNDISNQISSVIVGGGITTKTNDTFFYRKSDDRSVEDRVYKVRYVIPKEYLYARIPTQGFVLQETKTVGVSTVSYTTVDLNNPTELRNEKVIINATADAINDHSQVITITTELPHNFSVGDKINVQKIRSTNNSYGTGITSTYNGYYYIESIPNLRTFTYTISGVTIDPGTFTNPVNFRVTALERDALPVVSREEYTESYRIYKVDTLRNHIPGENGQDGVYFLTLLSSNAKTSGNVGYGISTLRFSQDVRNLYPQIDRDNFNADPVASISYADEQKIANVISDDKKKSITKESLDLFVKNTNIGFGITGISISGTGNTTVTIFTDREHQLNSIKSFSILDPGSGFTISTSVYSASLFDKNGQEFATANFQTTPAGTIDQNTVSLVYSGSYCGIGSTYVILSSGTNAVIQSTDIINNIGDGLELIGFNDSELKGIFKIQSVTGKKELTIYTPNGVNQYTPNTNGYIPAGYLASKGVGITSFKYVNGLIGIVTVTTASSHGLEVGNKITIIESGTSLYNNDFVVASVVGLNTITINVGIATLKPSSIKGTLFKRGFAANSSPYGTGQEGRATHIYSGFSTTTTSDFTTNSITIQLSSAGGFERGDYLSIGNEIIRLASIPSGNTFNIIRSQLGTFRETNIPSGSLVRKIKVLPVEFRRPSFLRASGHTFEYLGYGPGNYSNALPQKQSRTLEPDEVKNSQSRKLDSGLIVYSGVNDLGENYSGPKKTLYTGQDVVIDAPIVTFTGDDASQQLGNLVNSDFDDVLIRRSLTVEGGENGNLSSQFYGPVNFTRKLTNNSADGVEIRNLLISGLSVPQPKLFNVDNTTPTDDRPVGTISFLGAPTSDDGYVGNIYVTTPSNTKEWRRFGLISKTKDALNFKVDKLGVGIDNSSNPTYDFDVANNARINNLTVSGTLTLDQTQAFQDVRFVDIDISGVTTVRGRLDVLGFTTTKNLYVSGVSTFSGDVNFGSSIGVANTINVSKNIVFTNPNTYIRWDANTDFAFIRFNSTSDSTPPSQLEIAVGDNPGSPTADNIVVNQYNEGGDIARSLKLLDSSGNTIVPGNLGIGVANPIVRLDVAPFTASTPIAVLARGSDNNFQLTTQNGTNNNLSGEEVARFGLNYYGTGWNSYLKFIRGNSQQDGSLAFFTNDTQRLLLDSFGIITYTQNNNGVSLSGANFIIKQSGPGDSVITWRKDYQNANQRWYAGIDATDLYTWKLAHPDVTKSDNQTFFVNDTKLSVDVYGNAKLLGNFISAGIGTQNVITPFNGGVSIAQTASVNGSVSIGGTVTITGGSGGAALTLKNGGDLVFLNASNTGISSIFCDTDNQLSTRGDFLSRSYIKGNSLTVNLINPGGGINQGWTNGYSQSVGSYNFLRTDGSDTPLSTIDFVNCLGYIPQPPIAISNLPTGNSLLLDDFGNGGVLFNGTSTDFNLTANGNSFVPLGPSNLIVVLGGIVQRPAADYIIITSGTPPNVSYTNKIRFTTPPSSGTSCFVIALGGQGSLKLNNDWTAAGQILASTGVNNATTIPIGSDGQILTVDTTVNSKMKWSSSISISGAITGASLNTGAGSISGGTITGTSLTTGTGSISGGSITGTSLSAGSGAISGGAITGTSLSAGSGAISGGAISATSITATTTNGFGINVSPSTASQARYHLYNGGAIAEWAFGQKSSTDHEFKISKLVGVNESDYFSINQDGYVNTAGLLQVNTSGLVLGGDALRIKSGGDLRIYNNDNSGSVIMYCDTGGTMSIGGNLDVTGDITAYRTGSSAANNTGVIYLNSARNRYLYYNGSYYELNGAGLSVGGDLTATGDITAFASDIRLKTDIEPIQNSLQKVLELNGFTYRFNEKGEELGFDSSKKQVGVSAQEVQSVLPEAVAPAPANEEYLTVKYEKLVPLLIEAIKELKSEIEELKKSK